MQLYLWLIPPYNIQHATHRKISIRYPRNVPLTITKAKPPRYRTHLKKFVGTDIDTNLLTIFSGEKVASCRVTGNNTPIGPSNLPDPFLVSQIVGSKRPLNDPSVLLWRVNIKKATPSSCDEKHRHQKVLHVFLY